MNTSSDSANSRVERRELVLARIEHLTELPLLLMSFVMVPLLVGPIFWDLSDARQQVFFGVEIFIWALFAADLALKIIVAPRRLRYLRRHWLEVLVVAVPWFRPLRIIRVFLFGFRGAMSIRRMVHVDFLLVFALGLVIIAATIVASVETSPDSQITSFEDALWWSMVTVTTVGYGDMTPVTPIGRAIAMVLMLVGIGLFGGLTANLASLLMKADEVPQEAVLELVTEIRSLREEVSQLRREQAGG
ncbi:MAG: potassium channel family protein [Chloroflexi bacterium]|nr:potassium channel family protein [Chloroflexota bacterium]MCH8310687.1 potassium channel family protein [Chloroflexota bacterium]